MATQTVIELSKHFGKVKAVDGVSFHVENGEFVCILGPSGCGKSTVLRMIAGFEEPTSGDIRIDDVSVLSMPANRRPTAMVFQKYTLWPHMRVYDNIAFGLKLRKLPKPEIERKVQESLDLVGMSDYGQRFPSQLSGGQQQRVALARAIVLEPKILLLDEPFSNLDAALRIYLREELRRIQQRIHITTIFVTHDQEEALTLADRIAVMKAGKIEQLDHPGNIYATPKTLFVAEFIGAMNLLQATWAGDKLQIGSQTLTPPSNVDRKTAPTVAIRPEDLALVKPGMPTESGVWNGVIEQLMDMGHYRKAIINVPDTGRIKLYVSKSLPLSEQEPIALSPIRYLIYQDGQPPVEVTRQPDSGVLAYS